MCIANISLFFILTAFGAGSNGMTLIVLSQILNNQDTNMSQINLINKMIVENQAKYTFLTVK